MGERLLIIGWDGGDWEIIDDLLRRGSLPYLAGMLGEGSRATLRSTIPSHSWAAWSSFLTGRNPGGHGVFDFLERNPSEPTKRIPVSSGSVRGKTFLEYASAAGREVRAANIPVTFPAFPVNGRMIAGVAIPPGASFVHPKEWEKELQQRAAFPVNGMEWMRSQNEPFALVDEARDMVKRRTASYEVLLEGSWDVAVCVYVAPDRLQHRFANHLLPSHPEHEAVAETELGGRIRAVFGALDRGLERLIEAAGPGTTVVLMSDHGFRPVMWSCNMDRLLAELGFARRARTGGKTAALRRSSLVRSVVRTRLGATLRRRVNVPTGIDWTRTVAYQSAVGPGVSINLRGRERDGTVAPEDYDRVREEVRTGLLTYRDPKTGDPLVGEVHRREEVVRGPYFELAPDLLIEPSRLWTFAHAQALTSPTDWWSGAHRQEGILFVHGGHDRSAELGDRDIVDIPASVAARLGFEMPDLDGEAVEHIAGPGGERRTGATPAPTLPGAALSDEDQEFISEHLRRLGYIE